MRTLLVLIAVLACSACNTALELKDYAQSCSIDADCVAVYVGQVCNTCGGCANAAINQASKAKYDADARAVSANCPPRLGGPVVCAAAACVQPRVVCTAGTCELKPGAP